MEIRIGRVRLPQGGLPAPANNPWCQQRQQSEGHLVRGGDVVGVEVTEVKKSNKTVNGKPIIFLKYIHQSIFSPRRHFELNFSKLEKGREKKQ